LSRPFKAFQSPRTENSWSGDTSRRKRWLAGDLKPDDLATFLEIDVPQIGRKAITSTKSSASTGRGDASKTQTSRDSETAPGETKTGEREKGGGCREAVPEVP
jgi:hypothetical protein